MKYERINLEHYQLIWCDDETDISTNKILIDQLRKIIDYTLLFHDVIECKNFLKQTKDVDTFLICSCQFAKKFISKVHKMNHIKCIYVIHYHGRFQNTLITNFSKVKEIKATDFNCLLNYLSKDVENCLQQARNDLFSEPTRSNYTTNGDYCSWWCIFVDMICYLPYSDQCRERFIEIFENYYQNNETNMKTLKLFKETYTSESALTWYTRNTFLFRILNNILRQHNISMTFTFGFFIQDLFNQLKKEYENFKCNHLNQSTMKVYRAQKLSSKELLYLKERHQRLGNYDEPINSFLSATMDRSVALTLLDISDDHRENDIEYILFEINIDLNNNTKPFANITSFSMIKDEDEVLFMQGTRFRIYHISYDENMKFHLIKLYLTDSDEDIRIDNLIHRTTKQILKKCLDIIPQKLYRAKESEISTIFTKLNDLYPREREWFEAIRLHCFARMNMIYNWTEKLMLSYYKEAINIYEIYLNDQELNCGINIALIHLDIGYYYQIRDVDDYSLINEHYELGIIVCEYSLITMIDKEARIKLYETILKIFEQKEEIDSNCISDYVKYQELHIQEMLNYSSLNKCYIGRYLVELADRQNSLFLFEKALNNYQKSIELYYLSNPLKTNIIADIYGKIAEMYIEQKQDYNNGAHFKKIQIEYLLKFQFPDMSSFQTDLIIMEQKEQIGENQLELADLYIKLCQYSFAHDILNDTQMLYESIREICNVEDQLENIQRRITVVMQKLLEEKDRQ
ncbi:hypothetical protein I4U23_010969 [Adineta vaga]|nr:hypothetical protein I4U23_010969 [Adineta vaga]